MSVRRETARSRDFREWCRGQMGYRIIITLGGLEFRDVVMVR